MTIIDVLELRLDEYRSTDKYSGSKACKSTRKLILDKLKAYYETAFAANEQGNIYRPFTTFEQLSHERRMQLLADLPIPELTEATVVDYGVGAWGIGCVYPRLKTAKVLHGIDISDHALEKSRTVHERDPSLSGKEIRLSQSSGYELKIESNSVDLFFAGEAIEHVDLTDPFLEEVHRILKLGATAIFTTPNATPFVYRNLGMRWAVGFEHTALMSCRTLQDSLEKYFEITLFKGFNQSLHPDIDDTLDKASALAWVHSCEDDPENATGLIIMVRKIDERAFPKRRIDVVEGLDCRVDGTSSDLVLATGYLGRMIDPGSSLFIPIPSEFRQVALLFWSHDWSGRAQIKIGGATSEVDLYHPNGGCLRKLSDTSGRSVIKLNSMESRNPKSKASQVILMRAVFSH